MVAKFNLMSMLNEHSKAVGEKAESGTNNDFKVELISVYNLEPSVDNFYSVEDTADLKDSIEMIGVQQNLTVKPIPGTDRYKVIAGHRRRLASLKLVDEGKKQFEFVPCRVDTDEDDIKEKIMLIYTNSTTRQLSDWEKVEQLAQLKPLLKEYKKTHDLPGRVRELLAEALNVSPTQVGRIEAINDNLIPELKDELKQDNIKFSAAAELSRKPKEEQQAVYKKQKERGTTKVKEVAENKESKALMKAIIKYIKSESGHMTISEDIKQELGNIEKQVNGLEFGNIDFVINKGKITRVDIRQSIKPEKENK